MANPIVKITDYVRLQDVFGRRDLSSSSQVDFQYFHTHPRITLDVDGAILTNFDAQQELRESFFDNQRCHISTVVQGISRYFTPKPDHKDLVEPEKTVHLKQLQSTVYKETEASDQNPHGEIVTNVYLGFKFVGESRLYQWGLFSKVNVKRNEFLCVVGGRVVQKEKAKALEKVGNFNYPFLELPFPQKSVEKDMLALKMETGALMIVTTEVSNGRMLYMSPVSFLRYANENQNSNCKLEFLTNPNWRQNPRFQNSFYLVATRDVNKGEELLLERNFINVPESVAAAAKDPLKSLEKFFNRAGFVYTGPTLRSGLHVSIPEEVEALFKYIYENKYKLSIHRDAVLVDVVLTDNDIRSLRKNEEITDLIVLAYSGLIMRRSLENPQQFRPILILPPYLYEDKSYAVGSDKLPGYMEHCQLLIRRMLSTSGILVAYPVNRDGNHWVTYVYCQSRNQILFYDSLHGNIRRHELSNLHHFMKRNLPESTCTKRFHDTEIIRGNMQDWQKNLKDCGVAMCQIWEQLAAGESYIQLLPELLEHDFRNLMFLEIACSRLVPRDYRIYRSRFQMNAHRLKLNFLSNF